MSQREAPCTGMSWKCFGRNLSENHLGVALIQPGDSVIVENERFCQLDGILFLAKKQEEEHILTG